MKRKVWLVSIMLIVVVMMMAGCAPKTVEGPVTLTVWHDKEQPVIDVLVEALKKLEPDIIVQFEKKNGLTEALKLVGNNQGAAPDMYFFAHDKIGVYAEMGILAEITDFLDESELDSLVPITVESVTYKDSVYQLPLYFETLLFMYNKEWVSEAEVPRDTDALLAHMAQAKRIGRFGFVEQHSNAYYAAGWIHGFNATILDASGEPKLGSDEMKAAMAYHKQFVSFMPGESEYATVNTLFREGKADMTIGGPWMVPTLRAAGIDLGLSPMPIIPATGKPLAPYTGVQGIHVLKVSADSKSDAIKSVLAELIAPEVGRAIALASGSAPANEKAYEAEDIRNDDMVMMMRATAENSVPMPNVPEMDVMWTVTTNMLVEINMSGKAIDETVEAAQKKALELIRNMK
ncbi:MAG TPA: sugar ABC transporter substrate-binding protein [Clostridiales bacterium UBA8960]|jgi:arabinogalactan oligomer/maltooligosaccharide transport system substrate-binding protein|nr:sugar ABC transporter substrate-binding protein [Clostridiales bacterium UBA8960]